MSNFGSRHFFVIAQQGKSHMIPQPEFQVKPHRAVCGATHSWFLDIAGHLVELGCICHHDPNAELLKLVQQGTPIELSS